jgi:hypothetical protein
VQSIRTPTGQEEKTMRVNSSGRRVDVTAARRSYAERMHEQRLRDHHALEAQQHGFAPA